MTREMTTDWYDLNAHCSDGARTPTSNYPSFGGRVAENTALGYGNDGLTGMYLGAADQMMDRSLVGDGSSSSPFYDFAPFLGTIVSFRPREGFWHPILGPALPWGVDASTTSSTFVSFTASTYNPGFAGYGQEVTTKAACTYATMDIPYFGSNLYQLGIDSNKPQLLAAELGERIVAEMPGWYVYQTRWEHEVEPTPGSYAPVGKVLAARIYFRATPNIERASSFTLYGRPWWSMSTPGHEFHFGGDVLASFSFAPGDPYQEVVVDLPEDHIPDAWNDELAADDPRRLYLFEFTHDAITGASLDRTMLFKPHNATNESWSDGASLSIYYWEVTYLIPRVKFVLRNDFEEQDIDGGIDVSGRQFRRPRI